MTKSELSLKNDKNVTRYELISIVMCMMCYCSQSVKTLHKFLGNQLSNSVW